MEDFFYQIISNTNKDCAIKEFAIVIEKIMHIIASKIQLNNTPVCILQDISYRFLSISAIDGYVAEPSDGKIYIIFCFIST